MEDKNLGETQSNTDSFDITKLKLTQNFGQGLGVKKTITTIPVRKAGKQEWVRVHPAPEMRMLAAVIDVKDKSEETYIVTPDVAVALPGDVSAKLLMTAITRQGTLFVWPIKMPTEGERQNHWTTSVLEASEQATRAWIRVSANMQLGAYEVYEATGNLPEPNWPDISFQQIIRVAFKNRLIESMDHPVIQQLLGNS